MNKGISFVIAIIFFGISFFVAKKYFPNNTEMCNYVIENAKNGSSYSGKKCTVTKVKKNITGPLKDREYFKVDFGDGRKGNGIIDSCYFFVDSVTKEMDVELGCGGGGCSSCSGSCS